MPSAALARLLSLASIRAPHITSDRMRKQAASRWYASQNHKCLSRNLRGGFSRFQSRVYAHAEPPVLSKFCHFYLC